MSEQRDYATRTAIHAFYSHSQLLIVAEGELPSPEYEIDISQSPTDQGVPTFHLTRRPRPTATDAVQPTPFRYGEIFSIGRPPEIVLVRHSTGFDEVRVEFTRKDLVDIVLSLSGGSIEVALADPEPDDDVLPPPPPHAAPIADDPAATHTTTNPASPTPLDQTPVHTRPLTGSEKAGILADIAVRYRESVGYSNKLSFDEAFADALKKLPPASVKFADMLETVEVVHIGASFGGIAGFHRLEVRIRAYPD
ncbi:MAG: hypothetical protein JNL82_35025 [Myxococcales bacterium]|nr:hypothetical protein [Myxococcales bacterium]